MFLQVIAERRRDSLIAVTDRLPNFIEDPELRAGPVHADELVQACLDRPACDRAFGDPEVIRCLCKPVLEVAFVDRESDGNRTTNDLPLPQAILRTGRLDAVGV